MKKAPRPGFLDLALLAALYYGGAKLGMLTVMPEGMAIFWPPNAVVLATLIRFNGARLLPTGLVVVATEVIADVPTFSVTEALLFGLINFGEATLAFLLLRRFGFDPRFSSLSDVWKFVWCGPVAAAMLASLLGAGVYMVFRGGNTAFLEFARIWWFGDALGLMVLTPLFLSVFIEQSAPRWRFRPADAAVLIASIAALVAFWRYPALRSHLESLLLPGVIYVGARFPVRVTAVVLAAVALGLVFAMTRGVPLFGALPAREAVMQAQQFLFITALVALGLAALLKQLRLRSAQLESLNAELEARVRQRTAELEQLAAMDSLTGVFNRRSFNDALERECARAGRYGGTLSLVLADIDHFKQINDAYGHAVGDDVIRGFAERLAQAVRAGDLVARYGGEEFAVLLPETNAQDARYFAERVRGAVSRDPVAGLVLTASFGVAELAPGDEPKKLIAKADEALYRAKRTGRDRVLSYPLPEPVPEPAAGA